MPVLSILLAVLTVSPNSWKRARSDFELERQQSVETETRERVYSFARNHGILPYLRAGLQPKKTTMDSVSIQFGRAVAERGNVRTLADLQ